MTGSQDEVRQGTVTGVVTAAAQVISIVGMSVALAALLFTGALATGLPAATGSFIVAAGLVAVWLALRSDVVPLVSVAQDAPAIVLAAVIVRIVDDSPDTTVTDIVVVIAISTVAAGVLIWALGAIGAGEAIRFLPTVVVDGFIAGTGWLLVKGGVEIMVGSTLGLGDVVDLFGSDLAGRWLPGAGLAIVVFAFARSDRVPDIATSGAIVLATAIFFVVGAIVSSLDRIEADGWLVGPFDSGVDLAIVGPDDLGDVNWGSIWSNASGLVSLLVVTVVALLLNLSALESTFGRRYDTNAELRRTGLAQVGIGVLGSVPAFHALGDSVLARRMGVRGRAVGVGAGVAVVALGLFGAGLVGFAPLFVAGGLLVAVGLGLLVDWAEGLFGAVGWVERTVSLAIVGAIIAIGILEGVLVGLLLACAVFVWRYSRVDPIRRATDGTALRSRVDRTDHEREVLDACGASTSIFELQGYLFFGSVTRLLDRVRAHVACDPSPNRTVVLDFRFTTGIDPGAAKLMRELLDEVIDDGVGVVVSGASESTAAALRSPHADVRWSATLDAALADCEAAALARDGEGRVDERLGTPDFLDAFERRTVGSGEVLIRTGDDSGELTFLVDGVVDVFGRSMTDELHRVRQFDGPAWIGEIGFLRGTPRSADVVATTDVELAAIDRESFDRLRAEQPELVVAILDHIAITVADRAASVTEALMRSLD